MRGGESPTGSPIAGFVGQDAIEHCPQSAFALKQMVILDVMAIAFGFIIRVVAGAVAVHVRNGTIRAAGNLTGTPIRRSLVIGDRLWMLGDTGLGVADLSTLDQIGYVPLT